MRQCLHWYRGTVTVRHVPARKTLLASLDLALPCDVNEPPVVIGATPSHARAVEARRRGGLARR